MSFLGPEHPPALWTELMFAWNILRDLWAMFPDCHVQIPSLSQSSVATINRMIRQPAQESAVDDLFLLIIKACLRQWRNFPSTHREKRTSWYLSASSSVQNIRCATSSGSMETSFCTQPDTMATTQPGETGYSVLQASGDNFFDISNKDMLGSSGLLRTLRLYTS